MNVLTDKWILNHPTNGVIHPPEEEVQEWYMSDLINQDLKEWKSDLIVAKFHKEDADYFEDTTKPQTSLECNNMATYKKGSILN